MTDLPRRHRRGAASAEQAGKALAALVLVGALLAVMWVLEIIDYPLGGALDSWGVSARDLDDLPDIFTAPFLHHGFAHLIGNSVPFAVLGFFSAFRGLGKFLLMNAIVIIVGGLGVWLVSPPGSVTLGASGLVFGYFGYLLGRGLFERRAVDALIAVAVAVLYGGIIYSVLPTDPTVSWQGHLFGLLAGLWSAFLLRTRRGTGVPVGRISR
ncbi:rhomboid family intramembrane serine protease [Actinocorallia lasiicapitis]